MYMLKCGVNYRAVDVKSGAKKSGGEWQLIRCEREDAVSLRDYTIWVNNKADVTPGGWFVIDKITSIHPKKEEYNGKIWVKIECNADVTPVGEQPINTSPDLAPIEDDDGELPF